MPTLQLLHTLVHKCICTLISSTLIYIYTVLLPDDDDWSTDVALLDEDESIVETVVADVLEGLPMGDIDEVVPIKYTVHMVMSNFKYSISQHMHVHSYTQHCIYVHI